MRTLINQFLNGQDVPILPKSERQSLYFNACFQGADRLSDGLKGRKALSEPSTYRLELNKCLPYYVLMMLTRDYSVLK